MVDVIQVIASLALDGQALRFRHGVLVQSAARPGDEWEIFLLDLSNCSLQLIGSESQAAIVTVAGSRLTGPVRHDRCARCVGYARLVSCGELMATDQRAADRS